MAGASGRWRKEKRDVAAVGRHEKMKWAHIISGKVRATVTVGEMAKLDFDIRHSDP
jgi:hypothetical protein